MMYPGSNRVECAIPYEHEYAFTLDPTAYNLANTNCTESLLVYRNGWTKTKQHRRIHPVSEMKR